MTKEYFELPEVPEAALPDVQAFKNWYLQAKPGDWYTYHLGEHLHENFTIQYVKKVVWDYACDGKIYIFQKRDPEIPEIFFFKAQKASKRIPKLNPTRIAEENKRGR